MEATFFRFLVRELKAALPGRRLGKIYSPAHGALTLECQAPGDKRYLIYRPAKKAGLVFLSAAKPPNPPQPPARVMWLRKRAANRRIAAVHAHWPDLVLALELSQDPGRFLLLDLRGDLSLADGLPAGFDTEPQWPDFERALHDPEVWRDAPHLSPPLRRRLKSLPDDAARRFYASIQSGVASAFYLGQESEPLAWPESDDDKVFASALAAAQAFGEARIFPFVEQANERTDREELDGRTRRIKRTLAKITAEEQRLEAQVRDQAMAEALKAELWRIGNAAGLQRVEVNHPSLGSMAVPLNPLLTPAENMERYFRLADKGRRGLLHMARRRRELEGELDRLRQGLIGTENRRQPGSRHAVPLPRRYRELAVTLFKSSDGFALLRGKNKEANHALVTKAASPFDLWFHVQGGPGAHVLLKRDHPRHEVPRASLVEAATLAALKSFRANDAKAEVICALAGKVRAVKGAPLGQAQVDEILETMLVDLDPELERRLAAASPPDRNGNG